MFSEQDLQTLCDRLGVARTNRAADIDACTTLLCLDADLDPASLDIGQRVAALCKIAEVEYNNESQSPDDGLAALVAASSKIDVGRWH